MSTEKRKSKRTESEERLGPAFDAALSARHAGDLVLALRLCHDVLSECGPGDRRLLMGVNNEIAHIHHSYLKDYVKAERYFRRATHAAPKGEISSLGLFHSLGHQSRWKEALEEMVRLVGLRDSEEYRKLLCDGFGDTMRPELQSLIARARELLEKHADKKRR